MAEEAASAPAAAAAGTEAPPPGKMTMVAGVDDSDHSFYALQWALRHFFPPGQPQQYRLVVVTAKPSAASAVGLAGPGTHTRCGFRSLSMFGLNSELHTLDVASDLSDSIDRFIQAPRMCCRTWRRTSRRPPCASSTKPKPSAHRYIINNRIPPSYLQ